MRILITGAAGKIGRALRTELAAAGHQLRLADIKPIGEPEGESLILDIGDGEAVCRAMEGIEAVAHLAYGRGTHDDMVSTIQQNFDVNAKGTYNLLWAATQARVGRFVYTSTLSVFGSPYDIGIRYLNEKTPPAPNEAYSFTKYVGEEACRMFATRHELSTVCLRLCNVVDSFEWQKAQQAQTPQVGWEQYWRSMTTHTTDVARAIHLALTVPDMRYELIHISADNKGRVTEIQKAKELLGFWPAYRLNE